VPSIAILDAAPPAGETRPLARDGGLGQVAQKATAHASTEIGNLGWMTWVFISQLAHK